MSEIINDLDAFNFVTKKLLDQGCKSMNEDETCQYRGYTNETMFTMVSEAQRRSNHDSDYIDHLVDVMDITPKDAKCAVGHLISDIHYEPYIEGDGLNHTVFEMVQKSHPNWIIDHEQESSWHMLQDLQMIHDSKPVEEWEVRFEEMRERFENGYYTAEGK